MVGLINEPQTKTKNEKLEVNSKQFVKDLAHVASLQR